VAIVEVHPLSEDDSSKTNGKRRTHLAPGESGFNMMRAPRDKAQKVVSENLNQGETVRGIGGQKFICVSAGSLEICRGNSTVGSTLGPNHSYTFSSIRGSGPRDD